MQCDPHPAMAHGHRHPPPYWGRDYATIRARCAQGPSALITRRVTCRQVKRAGGPSGISASTVKGSGRVNRSCGRLGLGEDRFRPEGRAGESASQALRQFRDVASHRKEAAHGARAQAIDEAVDQRFGRGLSVPLRERGLRRGKRLGHERRKRHEIDAEAHVERLDLVLDEAQKMLGLARGAAQACLDHGR